MSDVVKALGCEPVNEHPHTAGVYVWVDEAGQVLYIGESTNLAVRIGRERGWARAFRQGFLGGSDLSSAGCGLAVVLSRGRGVTAHSWTVDDQVGRKATQNALIRLSALMGSTPPAQGAGWDYGRQRTDVGIATVEMLRTWFTEVHPLQAVTEAERAALIELFARTEDETDVA